MVLLSLLALTGLLATNVDAAYAVTSNSGGVNARTGSRPDRLEINGFASNGGPAWDLFILCMADIQARPQSQIDSWYQIAGTLTPTTMFYSPLTTNMSAYHESRNSWPALHNVGQ